MARGIYKRGGIYWVRYAGLDGKLIRESSHSEKFKVALDLYHQRKDEVKKGKLPETVRIAKTYLFSELAGEYLKFAERQKSITSKAGFIRQLSRFFGPLPLRRLTTLLVEQYQTEKLNKGNKPATVNRHLATLKHMIHKAADWNMVEGEILKRVRKVKLIPENNRRLRYLSKEECKALVNSCDVHLKPIVIMAINTGMRKGEILNLKWDNVDLKHGFILLTDTKNGERREIPINDTLRATLQGLMRRLDIPYVFHDSKSGKRYLDVKRSFNTACRRARIRDFHFHDLRHTFASHLVMAGVDLTTTKELLGHKTLTMTLRYAHLAPSHKVKAVDILNDTLNGNEVTQKEHNAAISGTE